MLDCGWRTLILENAADMQLNNGCLYVKNESEYRFPVKQIRNVVIASSQGSISIPLLNELGNNNVNLVFCDKNRVPLCEVLNTGTNENSPGNIHKQIIWDNSRKQSVWQMVVKNKIRNQMRILEMFGKPVPETLKLCEIATLPNDVSNREAQAARLYFSLLYGSGFRRHAPDGLNSAMNYGYTILRSSLDRLITGYGYLTAIGIKHANERNRFNLSCDIMEPFRPFIDKVVTENLARELDWGYKKELIAVLNMSCVYKNRAMSLDNAMEMYFQDITRYIEDGCSEIGEVDFER